MIKQVFFIIAIILYARVGHAQSSQFIDKALKELSKNQEVPAIDKMSVRFKDIYNEYSSNTHEWKEVSFIQFQDNAVWSEGKRLIDKNDYFFMLIEIQKLAKATNARKNINFSTDSTGALVRYQTPYERASGMQAHPANGRTNRSTAKMEVCQYYIWTVRNNKNTSDANQIYDIIEDGPVYLIENK